MQSFQDTAADVFPLHCHWFCALAESCLGVQLPPEPQLTVSLVGVISVESSALGGG